jgi:MFS family permease
MALDPLRSFRGLPRRFWVLFGATLINRLGAFVAPFLALYLSQNRELDAARVGTIIALFGAGAVVGGPVGGLCADRFGRRKTIALGMASGAIAMAGMVFAREPLALMPATFALGFTNELSRPATSAMVADLVPDEDRPRAYAALYWAVNLGVAFASVIAGFVAGVAFEWLFLVDALTCLACGAVVYLALPETRPAAAETAARHSPERANHQTTFLRALWDKNARRGPPASHLARRNSFGDVAIPFRDRRFRAFFCASVLVALVFYQFNVAMPLDMKAHGISTNTYGLLVALNGLLVVLLSPFSAPLMLRLSRQRGLALAAVLTGIGFGMFAFGGSVALYVAAMVVLTIGEIAFSPLHSAVVASLAPPHLRGTYQGAFLLSLSLAACVSPLVGGALLARGAGTYLWLGCFLLGLLAAAIYRSLPLAGSSRASEPGNEPASNAAELPAQV